MQTSVPSDQARTNWLQGIIHFEWLDDETFQVHPIHIYEGLALYQGQTFDAVGFDEAIIPKYGYAS